MHGDTYVCLCTHSHILQAFEGLYIIHAYIKLLKCSYKDVGLSFSFMFQNMEWKPLK